MGFRIPTQEAPTQTPKTLQSESINTEMPVSYSNPEVRPPLLRNSDVQTSDTVEGIPADIYERVMNNETVSAQTAQNIPPREDFVNGIPKETYDNVMGTPKEDKFYSPVVRAREVDLKQAQNILDVSEKLKMPVEEARAFLTTKSLEELKTMPELQDIQIKYAGITAWAQNPDNMKLLQQNSEWAKKIEDMNKKIHPDTWADEKQYVKDMSTALKKGLSSTGSTMAKMPGYAYTFSQMKRNLFVKYALDRPDLMREASKESMNNPMSTYFDEKSKTYQVSGLDQDIIDGMGDHIKNGDYTKAARLLSLKVAESSPSTIMAIVGSATGLSTPALISMGLISATQTYGESREKGGDIAQSSINSMVAGTAESLMEKVGTFGILGHWETALAKQYGKNAAKQVIKDVVKSIAYSAASEANEEAWTSLIQDTSSYVTGVDPDALDEAFKRMAGSALVGAASGGTMASGAGALTGYAKTRNQEYKAMIDKINSALVAHKVVDEVAAMRERKKTSQQSKTAPQQTQTLNDAHVKAKNDSVEAPIYEPESATKSDDTILDENTKAESDYIAKATPPNVVQFDINQFNETLTALGQDPAAVISKWGQRVVDAYHTAIDSGSAHFEIPYSDYYRYNDEFAQLDDIAYFNHAEDNLNTAKETMKSVDESLGEFKRREMNVEGEMKGAPEGAQEPEIAYPTGAPEEGEPVLRPIVLLMKGRSKAEQQVFKKFKVQFLAALEKTKTNSEVADLITEFLFRHLRYRATMLDRPLKELAEELNVGYGKDLSGNTIAYYSHYNVPVGTARKNRLVYGPNTKAHVVIHEFAHSMLDNMAHDWKFISEISERNAGQQEYFEVMEATAKLFNLPNIEQLLYVDKKTDDAIHETFAQTAESYYLRGKFGDSKLRKIFESMRKWMLDVANLVGMAYKQYPPLKITPEVHRIFQTLVDANEKVQDELVPMFPDIPFTKEMLGKKYDEYMTAIKTARENAVAKMYEKMFNKSFNEREKDINAAINTIIDQATAQVDARPSMTLMAAIKGMGEGHKITYESLLEVIAKGDVELFNQIKAIVPKGIIAGQKKAGTDVRDIMVSLELNDPQDMLDILREMGSREDMIEELTDQMIEKNFPTFKSDEEIHNIAVEAINEAGKEKVLDMELQELAKKVKTLQSLNAVVAVNPAALNKIAKKLLDEQANSDVLATIAFKLNPKAYEKMMARYNKHAIAYMKASDFENAFLAKQKEAIAYYSFKKAIGATQQVAKTRALIKGIKSTKLREIGRSHDVDIYAYAQAVVKALENNQPIPAMNVNAFKNQFLMDPSKLDLIEKYILAINIKNTRVDGTHVNTEDMSVEAFLLVGNLLQVVRHAASSTKFMEVQNEKIMIEYTAGKTAAEIGTTKKGDPTVSMEKGGYARWQSGLINVRTLFSGMMSSEESWAGSTIRILLDKVSNAQSKLILEKDADEAKLMEAVKNRVKNNPEMQSIFQALSKRIVNVFRGEVGKPILAPEIGHTFENKGEILQLLMYMGSVSGMQKAAEGGFYNGKGQIIIPGGYFHPETGVYQSPKLEAMITRMMEDGTIVKEDMDFVQTVWDIYERHHEPSKKSVRKALGFELGKIEAREFRTKWGNYKGGYSPISTNKTYQDLQLKVEDFAIDNPGTYVQDLYPVTNTSFSKERTQQFYPVNLDISLLRSRLNAVYRVAYLMPAMLDMGKILGTPQMREAIESRRPGAMNAMVIPWFKRTMAQQYTVMAKEGEVKAVDAVVHKLRKNNRIVAFALNYATVLKQFIGLIPAIQVVGTRYMLRSIKEVAFSPAQARKDVMNMHPRMKQRMSHHITLALRSFEDFELNLDKIANFEKNTEKFVYIPIQFTQSYVDTVIFLAAADQAKYEFKMTDPKAIANYATGVVERTQSSNTIAERASLLHGGEIKRAMTDFLSVPITLYGLNYEALKRESDKGKLRKAEIIFKSIMLTIVLSSIMGTIISRPLAALGFLGGDDDDEYLKDMALDMFQEAMGVILPGLGRVASGILGIGRSGGEIIPVVRTAKAGVRAAQALPKWLDGKDYSASEIRATMDTFTLLTGIPLSAGSKVYKILTDIDPNIDSNRKLY